MVEVRQTETGYALHGDLTVDTVSKIFPRTPAFSAGDCALDLTGVSNTDSAGLALLVYWIQGAAARGCRLTPRGAPAQMRSLVSVSGLDGILDGGEIGL